MLPMFQTVRLRKPHNAKSGSRGRANRRSAYGSPFVKTAVLTRKVSCAAVGIAGRKGDTWPSAAELPDLG
jgi:hypothetical protein